MRVFVKARPSAKEERVEKIDELNFIVSVKEPPKKGRANHAIIMALADYLAVPYSRIRLVSGLSARQKVFEIMV